MKMKNKRGQMAIVIFFVVLLLILIIGFIASIAVGLISWTSAQVTPIISGIGNVQDVGNFTQAANGSVVPANNFIQALPWVIGFCYVAALIFSIVFVIMSQFNPSPFFIGLYFFLMILLIFGAVVMSNMYQDIYSGDDVIAQSLHSQTLMSYMILRSPMILFIIAIIVGIILFTGIGNNSGGYGA